MSVSWMAKWMNIAMENWNANFHIWFPHYLKVRVKCPYDATAGFRGIAINRTVEAKLPSSPPIPSLPPWLFKITEEQCALAGVSPGSFRIYNRVTVLMDSNGTPIGLVCSQCERIIFRSKNDPLPLLT